MSRVTALKEFRDKYDFARLYNIGEEITGLDEKRIADLSGRGLICVTPSARTARSTKNKMK